MKQKLFTLCTVTLLVLACNVPALATTPAVTTTPVILPTNTMDTRGVVTLNNVSFGIPLGVADDAQSEMVAEVNGTENAPFEIAPAHLKFTLTGYQVQGKFHEPVIRVYPADEYAQMDANAAAQIELLKAVLSGSTLSKEAMPAISSFPAAQLFAAKMQIVSFQTGRGVRFLTQYAQYAAPINNRELFYHFQGLTDDGKYYIIAILPVTSSILPETEAPDAPVPAGGVPPATDGIPDPGYYDAVTGALNAMYEDSFNPSLFQLDALIQSITITP